MTTMTTSRRWFAAAVWNASAGQIREVLASHWPAPEGALVELIAQPAAEPRTRVEVRAAHPSVDRDAALHWLERLADWLRPLGSGARLVED